MLEQQNLNLLKTKDKINHFLLLTSLSVKNTKNGKQYLDLELRDATASYNGKMWSNFEKELPNLQEGNVVKILGSLDEFNNIPQIKIERIRTTLAEDNVNTSEFLPKSLRPLSEMEDEFSEIINEVENNYLSDLLNSIFEENNFLKYKKVPAGKAWHHAYIGGLLEHTLEIVKICKLMCQIHCEINKDLLLAGALLHDFGKIEELTFSTGFDYTDKGKLLGHIVIVANIIETECNKINDFPDDLKNQLIHIVLSHQGKLEYASPVVPKTLEAIVLHHADELSAKTNAYKNAILNEKNSGNNWTRYLRLAETSLLIPDWSATENDNFKETLF